MTYSTVATYPGRGIIWNRIKGAGAEPKNIGWGAASTLTSTSITGSTNYNVNLFGPQTEARVSGTSTILTSASLGDTYQVTGTIVAAAAKTISEAGLFDALSPSSLTTTVTNSLSSTTTLLTLGTSLAGANGNYYAQIDLETILVTGAAALSLTVTRGVLGSTAANHAALIPITMGGDGGASTYSLGLQTVNQTSMAALYGGNLFIHADFSNIGLNSNDSISFTFTDTLT
jgi:hypothetical protein